MRRTVLVALAATSLLGLPALSTSATADETIGSKKVCATAPAGSAACHAHVRTKGAKPDATTTWGGNGYSPAQLISAYKLGSFSGTATVAVVDAYHHPNAAADLQVYRDQFGLGTANLTIYNQNGVQGSYAANDVGWGQEEMLDLEMVSAICPACPIVYVGAKSASFSDLATAVTTASGLAKVVSNSYGGSEFSTETSIAGSYAKPGVTYTVSSGDNGYGVEVPAAFNTVVAVGGTSLKLTSTGARSSETVWSGAGSGCSAYITKPTWQTATSLCSRRSVADVAAVADPNTGVAVYDSYGSSGGANWYVFGGTSVAAPLIGAVYARTGRAGDTAQSLYTNNASLFDVTSGTNVRRCRAGYLCSGTTGYDGPTGNGTPNGSAAPF